MTVKISRVLATLFAVMLVTSLAVPAVAQEESWDEELYQLMVDMREPYNEEAASLDLGIANGMLANERITFRVDNGGETASFWIETDDQKRITDMGEGDHPNPTLVAKTDYATLQEIGSSETPAASFAAAVESGDIVFHGQSAFKWTATTAFRIALTLKGFLGL